MIWDVFMYAGEREMLQLRFAELAPIGTVRHVAIQGDRTFRGDPRELTPVGLPAVRDIVLRLPTEATPWEREKFQRDCGLWVVGRDIQPDDVVIISDADEIPRAERVEQLPALLRHHGRPLALEMRMHYWSAKWEAPNPWYHAKACLHGHLAQFHHNSADELRNSHPTGVRDAGWHLTYFGGERRVHDKLRAFSHEEFDTPEWHEMVPRWIEEGSNMHDEELIPYSGDDWPRGFTP